MSIVRSMFLVVVFASTTGTGLLALHPSDSELGLGEAPPYEANLDEFFELY